MCVRVHIYRIMNEKKKQPKTLYIWKKSIKMSIKLFSCSTPHGCLEQNSHKGYPKRTV